MVVRLRLARLGCRNRPFYRVMAADSRSPRDGKHIEVLGYYNPLPVNSPLPPLPLCPNNESIVVTSRLPPMEVNRANRPLGQDGGKRMGLNFDRVKYWLSVGAQPSDPVQRLLFRAGLLPPPPMVAMGRKGGSRDTRPVDPLSGRVMMPDQPTKASVDDHESNT